MNAVRMLALFVCLLLASPRGIAQSDDLATRKKDAEAAIEALKKTDSGMTKFFASSAGYAVFPKVSKGGFGFGGAYGRGLVFEKGKAVGRASITQGTFGFQMGGQVFREVIFFENKETLQRFKESKFEMGAHASVVAAAEGASKDARYREGVLVFTAPIKGLMFEASVGGQKFKFEPLP